MTGGSGHPFSTFELDVYQASGKPPDVRIEEHLRGCAQCRAYVEHLDALASAPPPSWALPERTHRRVHWGLLRKPWIAPLASAAVLVIGVVVWNKSVSRVAGSYVGVKGTPAVQALVHSGDQTRIWDGRTPVHPGDAIALRVDCQGFSRVVVATGSTPSTTVRLFEDGCPNGPGPLPFTLIPDDQPGEERIAIAFSDQPLDDKSLTAAIAGSSAPSSGVWVERLTFPKQVKP
jgi:hypothetical protein